MKMSSVCSELATSASVSLLQSSIAHASGRHLCRTVVWQRLFGTMRFARYATPRTLSIKVFR